MEHKFKFSLPFTTIVIIILNLTLYFFLTSNGDFSSIAIEKLIKFGGNVFVLSLTGEYWRFLSAMFLHADIKHLLFNLIILAFIGTKAEANWGKINFLFYFLYCGIVSSLISALWYHHKFNAPSLGYAIFSNYKPAYIVSTGASGALFGIMTLLLVEKVVTIVKNNDKTYEISKDKELVNYLYLLLGNLGIGIVASGIDNAAHLGGVAAGLFIGGSYLFFNKTNKKLMFLLQHLGLITAITITIWITTKTYKTEELIQQANEFIAEELKKEFEFRIQKEKELLKLRATEEAKSIPSPVSSEEASGDFLIVDGVISDITILEKFNRAYLTDIQRNQIKIVNLENLNLIDTLNAPKLPKLKEKNCGGNNYCHGMGAAGIIPSNDNKYVFVSSAKIDHISIFDLTKKEIINNISVGRFPRVIKKNKEETQIYAFNAIDNTISIIDIATQKLLKTVQISTDKGTYGLSSGRRLTMDYAINKVFVIDQVEHKLVSIDINDDFKKKIEVEWVDFYPNKILLSEEKNRLFILGTLATTLGLVIKEYELNSLTFIKEILGCEQKDSFSSTISADGKWIAIQEYTARMIRLISTSTFTTQRVFPTAYGTNMMSFSTDAKNLFVLNTQATASVLSIYNTEKTLDVANHVNEHGEFFCD